MPQLLPGNYDSLQLREAMDVYASAMSFEALVSFINKYPISKAPFFHSFLRQGFLAIQDSDKAEYKGARMKYQLFFDLLHFLNYNDFIKFNVKSVSVTRDKMLYEKNELVPSFYEQLCSVVNKIEDISYGRTYHPNDDLEDLLAEFGQLCADDSIILPVYEAVAGIHWSLVHVSCAACNLSRSFVKLVAVDATKHPAFLTASFSNLILPNSCPYCTETAYRLNRVVVQDRPSSGFLMQAMCTIWKLSDNHFVLQPPVKTLRNYSLDRILEIQLATIQAYYSEYGFQSSGSLSRYSVAYSVEELLDAQEVDVLTHEGKMKSILFEIQRKTKADLPLHDAIRFINKLPDDYVKDWPVPYPGSVFEYDGDAIDYLIAILLSEKIGRAAGLDGSIVARFTLDSALGFYKLGEPGLAKMACAKAQDIITGLSSEDVEALQVFHDAILYDIQLIANSPNQFVRYPDIGVLSSLVNKVENGSIAARMDENRLLEMKASNLHSDGRFLEVIPLYQELLTTNETLEGYLKDFVPDNLKLLHEVHRQKSGALANLGIALYQLYRSLEMAADLIQREPSGFITSNDGGDRISFSAEDLTAVERIQLDAVGDKLGEEFHSRVDMLIYACDLLQEALPVAQSINFQDYISVQTEFLYEIFDRLGELEKSEEMALLSFNVSNAMGLRIRAMYAKLFLTKIALGRRKGEEALKHLATAAKLYSKHNISVGIGEKREMSALFSWYAFSAVDYNGDPAQAIAISEGVKNSDLLLPSVLGFPRENSWRDEVYQKLIQERENLRLQLAGAHADVLQLMQELKAVQFDIESRREHLFLRTEDLELWLDPVSITIGNADHIQRYFQLLKKGTTIVGVVPIGNEIWVFAFWEDGCVLKRQAVAKGGVIDSFFHQQGNTGIMSADLIESLSDLIIGALRQRLITLTADDHIIVSAQSSFIPFSTLLFDNRPLCQYFTISYIHSTELLNIILQYPFLQPTSSLAIGGVKRTDVAELPGSVAEVEMVGEILLSAGVKVKLLLSENATIRALKNYCADVDVIHFSCHTRAPVDYEPKPALLFSIDDDIDSGVLSEDRILYELSIKRGAFVNIAACSSVNQYRDSRFLHSGLVTSLMVAGARTVMATLWEIEDENTSLFMERFYRELVACRSCAQALAATQRAAIAGELGLSLQFYEVWSAFVIFGCN